ncbi:unnamed protein product [Rotaria magnacalcarata]|uniref:Uncharacterized protein n=1 Tax=Rotaria magnacalcarata TaxID=392030 RepID=A0A816Z481_9BILA|nr:unnamed protein product [Rotaria magnacalcarata]
MSKTTTRLIKIIKKHASEEKSYFEAQKLIAKGADVRTPLSNGYSMIQYVTEEEARLRQPTPVKAENCRRIIKLLKDRASELLSELVLSNNGKLDEMRLLVKLKASCYQQQVYGPLGLLGKLLNQSENHVRLDVVRFLVETDEEAKFALMKEDDQHQTCLSLSLNNPKSSVQVSNYIQEQLNLLFNKIASTHSEMDAKELAQWICRGADPKATDEDQNTVLLNAVRANNVDLVRALIANGCNAMHKNKDDKTSFDIAKNEPLRNAQLLAILSEQIVNNKLKQLICAEKSSLKKEEVLKCLEEGANINGRFDNNDSFLHYLIAHDGTQEMIAAFVNEFNADILATNNAGLRPIELCILHDKNPYNVLGTFLKLPRVSTDTFFNNVSQKSIYQYAIEQDLKDSADTIKTELNARLWACVTSANTDDKRNQSVLSEAKKLIDYGAQINDRHDIDGEYKGWSVFHVACKTTMKSFVECLVRDMKADCAFPNSHEDYPISIAAEYGQLEIVQFLRECRGVQINVFNKKRDTPLHLAAKNHHYRIVRYLILWGADEEARNSSKETPLVSAQMSETKTEQDKIEKDKIISFLRNLTFPEDDNMREEAIQPTKSTPDLDTCELLSHIDVHEIQPSARDDQTKTGNTILKLFNLGSNRKLHVAAKNGNVSMARQAMKDGADICYRQNQRSLYEVAQDAAAVYACKAQLNSTNNNDRRKLCAMALGCQQISDDILQHAQTQLEESIKQSNFALFVTYCEAGIPITPDLLYLACTSSDNVEIVDYLVKKDRTIYEAMYNYTTLDSPYHLAKKNKFNKVATYIKYHLTIDCTEAIKKNDVELVKQLIRAGSSVDLTNTNNLAEALRHRNDALIQIICENGVKLPFEWLQSDNIVLSPAIEEDMGPDIAFTINRNLINRRLRLAASTGDFQLLIKCQRLGADINSKSCDGSTALLCAVQNGNYFRIAHSLVSRGATMLHSNENQSMSLIELCNKKNYGIIEGYLKEQLNVQFAAAILDDDRHNATAFAAFGADFNYKDEQKHAPLYYAIQYHDIDLVSWLCERGSNPTSVDDNGDYPITLAAEKGKISRFV